MLNPVCLNLKSKSRSLSSIMERKKEEEVRWRRSRVRITMPPPIGRNPSSLSGKENRSFSIQPTLNGDDELGGEVQTMHQEEQDRGKTAHEQPMRRATREQLVKKVEKTYKFDVPQFRQLPSPTESGIAWNRNMQINDGRQSVTSSHSSFEEMERMLLEKFVRRTKGSQEDADCIQREPAGVKPQEHATQQNQVDMKEEPHNHSSAPVVSVTDFLKALESLGVQRHTTDYLEKHEEELEKGVDEIKTQRDEESIKTNHAKETIEEVQVDNSESRRSSADDSELKSRKRRSDEMEGPSQEKRPLPPVERNETLEVQQGERIIIPRQKIRKNSVSPTKKVMPKKTQEKSEVKCEARRPISKKSLAEWKKEIESLRQKRRQHCVAVMMAHPEPTVKERHYDQTTVQKYIKEKRHKRQKKNVEEAKTKMERDGQKKILLKQLDEARRIGKMKPPHVGTLAKDLLQAKRDLPDSQEGRSRVKREEMDIKEGSGDTEEYASNEDRRRDIQVLIASLRARLQVEYPLLSGMPPNVSLPQPEDIKGRKEKQEEAVRIIQRFFRKVTLRQKMTARNGTAQSEVPEQAARATAREQDARAPDRAVQDAHTPSFDPDPYNIINSLRRKLKYGGLKFSGLNVLHIPLQEKFQATERGMQTESIPVEEKIHEGDIEYRSDFDSPSHFLEESHPYESHETSVQSIQETNITVSTTSSSAAISAELPASKMGLEEQLNCERLRYRDLLQEMEQIYHETKEMLQESSQSHAAITQQTAKALKALSQLSHQAAAPTCNAEVQAPDYAIVSSKGVQVNVNVSESMQSSSMFKSSQVEGKQKSPGNSFQMETIPESFKSDAHASSSIPESQKSDEGTSVSVPETQKSDAGVSVSIQESQKSDEGASVSIPEELTDDTSTNSKAPDIYSEGEGYSSDFEGSGTSLILHTFKVKHPEFVELGSGAEKEETELVAQETNTKGLNSSEAQVSLQSFITESDSFTQMNISLLQHFLEDANARAQRQKALVSAKEASLRQKMMLRFTRLQKQKIQCKERGDDARLGSLKATEQKLVQKYQEEKQYLQKVREELYLETQRERERLLRHHHHILRLRKQLQLDTSPSQATLPMESLEVASSTSELLKEEASSSSAIESPLLPMEVKEEGERDKDGGETKKTGKSGITFVSKVSTSLSSDGEDWSPASSTRTSAKAWHGLKKIESEKRHLSRREQQLAERRKNVEELIQWKQRLEAEEKHVQLLEHQAFLLLREKKQLPLVHPSSSRDDGSQPVSDAEKTSTPKEPSSQSQPKEPSGSASIPEELTHSVSHPIESEALLEEVSHIGMDTSHSQDSLDSASDTSPQGMPRSSLVDKLRKKSGLGNRSALSPKARLHQKDSSGSEDSMAHSQNETASDASDVESRIAALEQQLRRRSAEAEKLKKEQKRRYHEKLRSKEQALLKQIEMYDALINQTRADLEQELGLANCEAHAGAVKPVIKHPCVRQKEIKATASDQSMQEDSSKVIENLTDDDVQPTVASLEPSYSLDFEESRVMDATFQHPYFAPDSSKESGKEEKAHALVDNLVSSLLNESIMKVESIVVRKETRIKDVTDFYLQSMLDSALSDVLGIWEQKWRARKGGDETDASEKSVSQRISDIMACIGFKEPTPSPSSPKLLTPSFTFDLPSPESTSPLPPSEKHDLMAPLLPATVVLRPHQKGLPSEDGVSIERQGWIDDDLVLISHQMEHEKLRRQQAKIEHEIQELEALQQLQQIQQQYPNYFIREIPNKPPPPYTPPFLPSENLTPAGPHSLSKADLQKLAEEVLKPIPSKKKEVEDLVMKIASDILETHEKGVPLEQISPNSNLTSAEELLQNGADAHARKFFKDFLFDFTKELLVNVLIRDESVPRPAWTRSSQIPHSEEELKRIVADQVLCTMGLVPRTNKDSLIIRWSKKKRDHVDEILIRELQEEEKEWTNYDAEEETVKHGLANAIFDNLLLETGKIFEGILSKRGGGS